nr:hypothetical protein Iba_chr07aCG5480 [Ipomoea batatas]
MDFIERLVVDECSYATRSRWWDEVIGPPHDLGCSDEVVSQASLAKGTCSVSLVGLPPSVGKPWLCLAWQQSQSSQIESNQRQPLKAASFRTKFPNREAISPVVVRNYQGRRRAVWSFFPLVRERKKDPDLINATSLLVVAWRYSARVPQGEGVCGPGVIRRVVVGAAAEDWPIHEKFILGVLGLLWRVLGREKGRKERCYG